MTQQILTVFLTLLFAWGGKRYVPDHSSEIPIHLNQEINTVQHMEEFIKGTQNDPPEIRLLVKEESKSSEQQVEEKVREMEDDPPESHKPVKEKSIKSMEEQVEESVREAANEPPEPSSWFSLLTTTAYWFQIILLISAIILKYILHRNDLALRVGQYLVFQKLIELIQEGLGNFNFQWSSDGAALENGDPSLFINIDAEYCRSNAFHWVILMLLLLLIILLVMLLVLTVYVLLMMLNELSFSRFSPARRLRAIWCLFKPRKTDNITLPRPSITSPRGPIHVYVQDTPPEPTILPSGARNAHKQTSPRKPKRSRHVACHCPSDNIIPTSSASPQMKKLRKNRMLRRLSAFWSHFKKKKTDDITPSDNFTPPSDNITLPRPSIKPPRGPIPVYVQDTPSRRTILPSGARNAHKQTPPRKPKRSRHVACQCPSDNIIPTSSASPQMKKLRKNRMLRRLSTFWSLLKPKKTDDITPSDNFTPPSDNITPPRGPIHVYVQDTPPQPTILPSSARNAYTVSTTQAKKAPPCCPPVSER